jgi:hypothetical protein
MASENRASIASAAVLCLTLLGCSGPTSSLPSAPTPAPTLAPVLTTVLSPSPSSNCTAALVLGQVDQLLAGQDFEAHYLTIGGRFTLSVWLVDPEIDPGTSLSGMAAADHKALEFGLAIAYRIVDQIPCARRVFDQINPMIVDGRFQHWYRDFLPVGAFVGLRDPTTNELVAAIEATGTALEVPRATVPQAVQKPSTSSCNWQEARAAIHAYLGSDGNTAAYLIIGSRLVKQGKPTPNAPDDVGVEVQWQVRDTAEAADPLVRERLGHVAAALACLSPAVDSLEAFVVDPGGRTILYAVVLGPTIRAGAIPLPRSGVHLYRMTSPAQP